MTIGSRNSSRLLRVPLRPRGICHSGLHRSGRRSRLVCEADPKRFSSTTKSQAILENPRPCRILSTSSILLLFQQRIDTDRCGDHDYRSLHGSRLRKTAYPLGPERIQRSPETRPHDRRTMLLRPLLRLHPRPLLGTDRNESLGSIAFIVYLLWVRKKIVLK